MAINSIVCDICNTWYHRECAGMNLTTSVSYIKNPEIEWECAQRGMQYWFRGNNTIVKSKIIEYCNRQFSGYIQQEK